MNKDRYIILQELLLKLEELKKFYEPEYPGDFLIFNAINFLYSLKLLEEEQGFDKRYLGIK